MCMNKSELEKKIQDLRSLKALAEELAAEVKAAEYDIIDYMTTNGIDTEITNTAKITYKSQSRKTLDENEITKALAEALGDEFTGIEPFKKITSYNVLRIK